jgi:hypothetical protein
VREITDGSGLILDPEGDTYHMVAFSLVRGPRQYENTARLLALGHLALSSQQMTPERRTRIDEWQTMQQYLDDDVENEYAEGIEANPEVAAQFDMKGTDAASDAFRQAIDTQLMGGQLAARPPSSSNSARPRWTSRPPCAWPWPSACRTACRPASMACGAPSTWNWA